MPSPPHCRRPCELQLATSVTHVVSISASAPSALCPTRSPTQVVHQILVEGRIFQIASIVGRDAIAKHAFGIRIVFEPQVERGSQRSCHSYLQKLRISTFQQSVVSVLLLACGSGYSRSRSGTCKQSQAPATVPSRIPIWKVLYSSEWPGRGSSPCASVTK